MQEAVAALRAASSPTSPVARSKSFRMLIVAPRPTHQTPLASYCHAYDYA